MKLRKGERAKERLESRRDDFDNMKVQPRGWTRPGSQNPHKGTGSGRKKKK